MNHTHMTYSTPQHEHTFVNQLIDEARIIKFKLLDTLSLCTISFRPHIYIHTYMSFKETDSTWIEYESYMSEPYKVQLFFTKNEQLPDTEMGSAP